MRREKVSPCTLLILAVTLKWQCMAEYCTWRKMQRPNSIWLTLLPEQGSWLLFKQDPLWTVGELKAREINPAESAGTEGVWSCDTSPEAEQRRRALMMHFKLQRLREQQRGSQRHLQRYRHHGQERSNWGAHFGNRGLIEGCKAG